MLNVFPHFLYHSACFIAVSPPGQKRLAADSELVAKLRVIASDKEKAPAGSFFDRRFWSKNVPRGDFDEVSRDKTHLSNKLSVSPDWE